MAQGQREAADLARRLGERIQSLVAELLPYGHREARWWRVGSLAGEEGQSLAVVLWGPRQGKWYDYSAAVGGDALDLVAGVRFANAADLRPAMDWARDWLGLPAQHKPLPRRPPPQRDGRRDDALKIFLAAKPLRPGDPVWRYLGGRGVDLARLPRAPGALRHHPALWHWEAKRHWPAMVAAVCDADGRHCATHCTWLEGRNLAYEAAPTVGKAPIGQAAKRTLGGYRGGCIRLWRGAAGQAWDRIEPGATLLISEGIEDLLSYLVCFDGRWHGACALSISSMLALQLPPEFTELRILAQSDPVGSPAARTLDRVVGRFQGEGRRVFTLARHALAKDVNEMITHPALQMIVGESRGERGIV